MAIYSTSLRDLGHGSMYRPTGMAVLMGRSTKRIFEKSHRKCVAIIRCGEKRVDPKQLLLNDRAVSCKAIRQWQRQRCVTQKTHESWQEPKFRRIAPMRMLLFPMRFFPVTFVFPAVTCCVFMVFDQVFSFPDDQRQKFSPFSVINFGGEDEGPTTVDVHVDWFWCGLCGCGCECVYVNVGWT